MDEMGIAISLCQVGQDLLALQLVQVGPRGQAYSRLIGSIFNHRSGIKQGKQHQMQLDNIAVYIALAFKLAMA